METTHPADSPRLLTTGFAAALELSRRAPLSLLRGLAKWARSTSAAVAGAEPGQMAGTISSPGSLGSSGQSPGSSSGTAL